MLGTGVIIVSCCALFEFLFLNQCIHSQGDITTINLNKTQFKCGIKPNGNRNQVLISNFNGVFAFGNADEKAHFSQELSSSLNDSSKINILLEVCKMDLRTLKIKSYEDTNLSSLSNIERHAGNITELTWEMDGTHTVIKSADIFKHLEVLTIDVYRAFIYPTFLHDMKKLQKLVLNCLIDAYTVNLPIRMFQGLTNLSELNLLHCYFNKTSAVHFQDLTNLRVLNISNAFFNDFAFLRYVCL